MIPSLDHFLPLIGSTFVVETQAGPVDLVLTEAKEYPRNGLPPQFRTQMSLMFSGPVQLCLAQDNYYFNHPAIGRQAWLMAPVSSETRPYLSAVPAPQETTQRYQIVFA